MNYELARSLKDAGFPQSSKWAEEGATWIDDCYVPTLEELIDACGDKFYGLLKAKQPDGFGEWKALEVRDELNQWGTTPSEAVGNLYVALNVPPGSNPGQPSQSE